MKKKLGIITIVILVLGTVGFGYTSFLGPRNADACGWGSSGGKDYVPQRRGEPGASFKAPAMTKEQAYDVVANHIKKLNPTLEIGKIIDNGDFYAAEVISGNGEVVEHVGVDKQSGRLVVLN
ncbi:MAG: hypothetical protein ABII06_13250 [Pseudomonadota bacterium]